MCGILSILNIQDEPDVLRKKTLELVKRIRHRGPDWSGIFNDQRAILAHERLAIVDVDSGAQPLYNTKTGAVLAVNGEIYNHRDLRKTLKETHDFQTQSDCEVILYLYEELGPSFVNQLNGIFAFVLYDPQNNTFMIARDHIGIVPLYWGWDEKGQVYVASELKAIVDVCKKVEEFPPGHFFNGKEKQAIPYYRPPWKDIEYVPKTKFKAEALSEALESAVKRQLMCDVPYGLLISGGVDSSLIAAIAAKLSPKRIEEDEKVAAWWPRMHSFSVGLKNSPDLEKARVVANHIGSVHHEVLFTVKEGLDAISDVIYQLETFDVTTIRAATPMYLMARKIRAMGIKMVLSGEGADEIFGGYLYFHKAPDPKEFHQETVRKLNDLHMYDCLRANKSMAAWGVETRVPFLDKEFIEVAMGLDPADKMITAERMEKHILREAFDGLIPNEVLWRQKEQFSDGVGYSWIDSIRDHVEKEITDQMMENARFKFTVKVPMTKEAYWYRSIFESHYPNPSAVECIPDGPSVACSTPTAIKWDKAFENFADPSGRAVKDIHEKGY